MKVRVKALLELVYKANAQIDLLTNSGYKVEIAVWGSMGRYETRNDVRLVGCTKDIVRSDKINRSTNPLKVALNKVTKELKILEREGYCVEMTPQRPNGHIALFVDCILTVLTESNFGMPQMSR